MFRKFVERIVPFLAIGPLVMVVTLLLVLSGAVAFECNGLGIDAGGRVYVGKPNAICVYESGSLVNEIDPQTNRGYAFIVTEENTILLSTSTMVYSLDLEGNIFESYEDEGAKMINTLRRARYRFKGADGRTYSMDSKLGYYKLVRDDGTVVYRMPITDYFFLVLMILSVIAFALLIICIIIVVKTDDDPPREKMKFDWSLR